MTATKRFTKLVVLGSIALAGFWALALTLAWFTDTFGAIGFLGFLVVFTAALWTILEWDLERAVGKPDPRDKIAAPGRTPAE